MPSFQVVAGCVCWREKTRGIPRQRKKLVRPCQSCQFFDHTRGLLCTAGLRSAITTAGRYLASPPQKRASSSLAPPCSMQPAVSCSRRNHVVHVGVASGREIGQWLRWGPSLPPWLLVVVGSALWCPWRCGERRYGRRIQASQGVVCGRLVIAARRGRSSWFFEKPARVGRRD